jgi:hypothetical protein
MRRIALLGLLFLLPGCSGAWDFLGDGHSFTWNPNQPIGDSENMRRVRGEPPHLPPIGPEPGNVWPGPVPPEPTLSDLEKSNQPLGGSAPANPPPGGEPPPPTRQPRPAAAPGGAARPSSTTGGGASSTAKPGGGSIVVPNGNGTSTVIGPDGSISTVPTPK